MAAAFRIRPTVIVPEAAPLLHLAAGDALGVLTGMGPEVVVGVVALEATVPNKPYAAEIAAWLEAAKAAGSNSLVVAETELGPVYRLAQQQGIRPPRNAGEIAVTEWLSDHLVAIGGPALVVYQNGRVPRMLAREGVDAPIAVATTRNFLELAQQQGIIADADAVWARIIAARPSASPVSALTFIGASKP